MRGVIKIGAALLSIIPFASTGCNDKVAQEKPGINHVTEAFQFKRNEAGGKVFVEPNNDTDKLNESLNRLGLSDQDIRELYFLERQFNNRANKLEQKEISVSNLTNPNKPPENIDIKNRDELIRNGVFISTLHSYNSSFVFPFYGDFDDKHSKVTMLPAASDLKSRRLLPLSISLDNKFQLVPESVGLRYYLDNVEPRIEEVKEGIYFKVRYDNQQDKNIEVVVPMCNLPILIDNGNKLYIIGLDKFESK